MSASSDVLRQPWATLESPHAWTISRSALDAIFGLYRRRASLLGQWGVLDQGLSMLDVGCGVGQYASLTSGRYLGLDLNEAYVEHARRRNRNPVHEFRAADVSTLDGEHESFDIVLMVDFLHHLDDEECQRLLSTAARLSQRYVISLEPVREQTNVLGRWIIDHDRGRHMRSLADFHALFAHAPLTLERSDELRLGPINTRAVLARGTRARHAPVLDPDTQEVVR